MYATDFYVTEELLLMMAQMTCETAYRFDQNVERVLFLVEE